MNMLQSFTNVVQVLESNFAMIAYTISYFIAIVIVERLATYLLNWLVKNSYYDSMSKDDN